MRRRSYFAHQYARYDVVVVTNAAGAVVERRRFDDFGRVEVRDVGGAVVAASPSGLEYGFQGRRLDPETGLVFFRARYYSPETGRFVQRDPVWDAGNVGGQYTFCGNGPASGRDPGGMQGEGEGTLNTLGPEPKPPATNLPSNQAFEREYQKLLQEAEKKAVQEGALAETRIARELVKKATGEVVEEGVKKGAGLAAGAVAVTVAAAGA